MSPKTEIFRSLMCAFFCGGSCVEDISGHLMRHLSLHIRCILTNDFVSTARELDVNKCQKPYQDFCAQVHIRTDKMDQNVKAGRAEFVHQEQGIHNCIQHPIRINKNFLTYCLKQHGGVREYCTIRVIKPEDFTCFNL